MNTIKVGYENSSPIYLHYVDNGTGKPVVLLHGWPTHSTSWEKQSVNLILAGFRVITYDRRGFGKSSRPNVGYDFDTLADDLHKLLCTLDLRDVALIGCSMGCGEIARYLGTYGSERIEKAIFISTLPPLPLQPNSELPSLHLRSINGNPSFMDEFLIDFFNCDTTDQNYDPAFLCAWPSIIDASALSMYECVTAWNTDFRDDLRRISVPSLVIHGDSDKIFPHDVSGSVLAALVASAKLEIIVDGPHGLLWTHTEQVNKLITTFLQD